MAYCRGVVGDRSPRDMAWEEGLRAQGRPVSCCSAHTPPAAPLDLLTGCGGYSRHPGPAPAPTPYPFDSVRCHSSRVLPFPLLRACEHSCETPHSAGGGLQLGEWVLLGGALPHPLVPSPASQLNVAAAPRPSHDTPRGLLFSFAPRPLVP